MGGAFCSNEIFELVLVIGNMDSKQYTDMLAEHFWEDFFRMAGNRAIFPQDNAPIHVSRHSKAFFWSTWNHCECFVLIYNQYQQYIQKK